MVEESEDIEQRLEKLEKELSTTQSRYRGLLILAGLAIGALTFFLGWNWYSGHDPVRAVTSRKDAIRANKIILETERGEGRAAMMIINGKPGFFLLDEKENIRSALRMSDADKPVLGFYDKEQDRRAAVGIGREGPLIELWGQDSDKRVRMAILNELTRLAMTDSFGDLRIAIGMGEEVPVLFVRDSNGQMVWSAP